MWQGAAAALALDQAVDGLLRHPPPGGELAAGDRQHARRGLVQLRFARDVDRLARVAGRDQRPHAGVGADQVGLGERGAEELVDSVEQVLGVVRGRLRVGGVALEVVVGGADQGAAVPGQREDHPPLPRRDDAGGLAHRQVGRVEDQVGAATGGDPRHVLLADDLLGPDLVGEDAGRVDDVVGADLEALARLSLDRGDPGGVAVDREHLGHVGAVEHHRAEALGLAEHGQDQAHVVGLAVVEEVGVFGVTGSQGRDQLQHLLAVDRAVAVGRPVEVLVLLLGGT